MALQKEKNGTAKANQTGERAGKDAGCRKDREDSGQDAGHYAGRVPGA